MTQELLQLLFSLVMYSIMGFVVGVGILLNRRFPQIGQFLTEHPVVGWTLAFAAGSAVTTILITIFEFLSLTVLQLILTR